MATDVVVETVTVEPAPEVETPVPPTIFKLLEEGAAVPESSVYRVAIVEPGVMVTVAPDPDVVIPLAPKMFKLCAEGVAVPLFSVNVAPFVRSCWQ